MDTTTQNRAVTLYQAAPPAAMSLADTIKIAEIFAASGFFADAKQMAQAVTKILAGAEIGFGPFASMQGVYVIQGRTSISANLLAAAIKRSGKYNYRVLEMTPEAVELAFYEWDEEVGKSRFTREDAARAHTKNMDAYPRNMLFARALSNGARWYCGDIFAGGVYTPEELGAEVSDDGSPLADLRTGAILEAGAPSPPALPPGAGMSPQLRKALASWHEESLRAQANGIEPAPRDLDTATAEELYESATRLHKLRAAAESLAWPTLVLKAETWGVPYAPLPELITRRALTAAVEALTAALDAHLADHPEHAPPPDDDDDIPVPF